MSNAVVSTKMPPSHTAAPREPFFNFLGTGRSPPTKDYGRLTPSLKCRDKWVEKVFHRQEVVTTAEPQKHKQKQKQQHKHKHNFIQRTVNTLTHSHSRKAFCSYKRASDDEQSYKEELAMYIAESSANLRYDGNGPRTSSNDGPRDRAVDGTLPEDFTSVSIAPRDAAIINVSAWNLSMPSDKTDEFVLPPVEIPCKYRRLDRQGGVLVAGRYVLFTNRAFKRQMHDMGRLGPLPERRAVDKVSVGLYYGKMVEV